jgi:hypothetical protein
LEGDAPERKKEASPTSIEEEVTLYRQESQISLKENPLVWWYQKRFKYPTLYKMAKEYLAPPATSAAIESAFSHAGLYLTTKRQSMSPTLLRFSLFLKINGPVLTRLQGKKRPNTQVEQSSKPSSKSSSSTKSSSKSSSSTKPKK